MESENSNQERVVVHVWGWEIRVLHWVNAFLILTLALLMLGKEGMEYLGVEKALREPINTIHVYFGYVFAVTFTLRIIAGFVGSHYARWH
ncbi:MAG: cytochrome b/b6 domain-containing protein, partial [Thermodesulfobacteriota bacterium]